MPDAEWIVIRKPLWGHNNTPFGRPSPGRPIGRPGVGHPQGVFCIFGYYQLDMLFLNMVCLIVALAISVWLLTVNLSFRPESKARIEARNKSRETPLHRAASYNHVAIMEFLLERGAKVISMIRRTVLKINITN
jgi:hypothetical protein